ncbi:hypothetical protein DPSP01_011808 [Paraphaeosphaeria sporulosa]
MLLNPISQKLDAELKGLSNARRTLRKAMKWSRFHGESAQERTVYKQEDEEYSQQINEILPHYRMVVRLFDVM